MHACGHDAHTAIAAGIALTLEQLNIDQGVRVVFQPAEGASGEAAVSATDGGFELDLPREPGHLDVESPHYRAVHRPRLRGRAPDVPPTVVVAPRRSFAGRVEGRMIAASSAGGSPAAGVALARTRLTRRGADETAPRSMRDQLV